MKSTEASASNFLTGGVVTKHIKPTDSTLRDVMWNSRQNNTGQSRHFLLSEARSRKGVAAPAQNGQGHHCHAISMRAAIPR
jgi:hypothetical protein